MKIAIFGDSISNHPLMTSLTADFLTRMGFEGADILRFAANGEDTQQGLRRLQAVADSQADYYMIFFGANDASRHHDITPEGFEANLEIMIDKLGAQRTSLITTPYVNEQFARPHRNNQQVALFVEAAKAVAERTGAQVIDLNHAMTIYPGSDEFLVEDGLHFSQAGYELVTSLIAVNIKNRKLTRG